MPSRVIRFSTAQPARASLFRAGRLRAQRPRPIRALWRDIAVSIVRTQSPKRLAFAARAGRDEVADLDGAVGDDHAVDQQFKQRSLLAKVRVRQALAHAPAERLGVGGQAGRLTLPLGVARELTPLSVQRQQSTITVAPTALVLGPRHHPGEIGVREPLELLAQRGPAATQVGPTRLQLLRQPAAAARPPHRVRDQLGCRQHRTQVAPDQRLQGTGRNIARRAALAGGQQKSWPRFWSSKHSSRSLSACAGRRSPGGSVSSRAAGCRPCSRMLRRPVTRLRGRRARSWWGGGGVLGGGGRGRVGCGGSGDGDSCAAHRALGRTGPRIGDLGSPAWAGSGPSSPDGLVPVCYYRAYF
jgi:hypothetical protein